MNVDVAARERQQNLDHLFKHVEDRSSADRNFKRAIGSLPDDLIYIGNALRNDPQSWRSNRAFHAVHVPSMIAVISVLDEIEEMTSTTPEDTHQILSSLHQVAELAKAARRRIEQSKLTDTKVELEVLADYAQPPSAPYVKPSLFTRAFDGVASASEGIWDGAKSGAASVPDLIGTFQSGVSNSVTRAASVPILADNLRKTVSESLSSSISKPVTMRLNASGSALKNGVGTGVGLGVIAGVLCPPLLPLSAGGAVLAAVSTWRKEIDRASELNDMERQSRIAELAQERS
ncbi:MAG: hypothetical protein WBC93_13690, partial [Sulfitobacter sp.]